MEQKNTKEEANIHTTADTDLAIAYQNKDIVSKLFGDQMKGKQHCSGQGIADHVVTDETLMHLVLLLTYKGEEKKQEAIRACVDLARQLPDK